MIADVTTNEPVHRLLLADGPVRVGLFRCRPWHALFHEDRRALGHYLVFPASSVYIRPDGEEWMVADPNLVMLYNAGQTYRREKLAETGDRCVYFGFDGPLLLQVLQQYDPSVTERPQQPFVRSHGPSDATSYLLQQRLARHLQENGPVETLAIQELALALLGRVLRRLYPAAPAPAPHKSTRVEHATLAQEVKAIVDTRFAEGLTLDDLATSVAASPYHLCRVFRQETGHTIHQYRNQVRLRLALHTLLESQEDVSTVALDVGYSSHSHFTHAFRRAFGLTPSAARRQASARWLRKMSKNLTV
jgi:AraC-like DNA-binding protein